MLLTNVLRLSPRHDRAGDDDRRCDGDGDAGVLRHRRVAVLAIIALALLALAVLPRPVTAASVNAVLTVTVTVPATCQITATPLAFGIYTGAVDLDPSTLTITCTNTTTYTVGLNAGLGSNPAATVTSRHMNGPAASGLAYALYRDASHTLNWGQTNGTDTVAGTGNGTAQILTVYGRISAGQYITPGNYGDTVIATITY